MVLKKTLFSLNYDHKGLLVWIIKRKGFFSIEFSFRFFSKFTYENHFIKNFNKLKLFPVLINVQKILFLFSINSELYKKFTNIFELGENLCTKGEKWYKKNWKGRNLYKKVKIYTLTFSLK